METGGSSAASYHREGGLGAKDVSYLVAVFWTAHAIALVGWLAILVGGTSSVAFARYVSLAVSVAYTLLFVLFLHDARPLLTSYGLDGVANFLGGRPGALVGWVHYLAFDLFVGTWEAEEAQRSGMPAWAGRLALVLTFAIVPLGLNSFFVLRRLTGRLEVAPQT